MPQPEAGAHGYPASGKCLSLLRPGLGLGSAAASLPGARQGSSLPGHSTLSDVPLLPLVCPQETDQLEDEKSSLQTEIANLLKEKEKLEFILAAHRPACKIPEELQFSEELAVSSLELLAEAPPMVSCSSPESEEAAFALPMLHEPLQAVAEPAAKPSSNGLELKAEPFDDFLFSRATRETPRSVPDVDLAGASSFYAADWEALGAAAGGVDLEPLCTPVVTCTPCPSTYTSSFVFTYPETETFPSCAAAHRKGSSSNEPSSDSLSSPTLLAL